MRQDFSGSGILNSNRNLISKFLNDNAPGPILSIQNNLSSANKNFIADKISSNSQTLTEDKNVVFELDKNRINKDLTASVQDQDLTYFINEQTHKTPVAVYQVPTATRVAYTGVPVHVNQTTVHTVHAAAPQKVHVPVVASPQPVHYVSVAESHPPAHVVVEQQPTPVHIVSAPPPSVTVKPVFLPQLPVVEEIVIVEEVKEESAHNLVCHPDEPTYIHDVNFNLCPCNEEKAAAAPIMFAETTKEVKERGGFPWWLLLLILLGLFLIALLLCLTMRKKEAIQPVKPIKNFVIEKKTKEHDEEEIEKEIQTQLQARKGSSGGVQVKKQEPVALSAEPRYTVDF